MRGCSTLTVAPHFDPFSGDNFITMMKGVRSKIFLPMSGATMQPVAVSAEPTPPVRGLTVQLTIHDLRITTYNHTTSLITTTTG